MRVIDLLNKMANGEELPKKVLIRDKVYYLIEDTDGNKVYSQGNDKHDWEAFIDHTLLITRKLNEEVLILDKEVELIEQQDIDIQGIEELEIGKICTYDDYLTNQLIKAVKQLDRKIREER